MKFDFHAAMNACHQLVVDELFHTVHPSPTPRWFFDDEGDRRKR